MVLTGRLRRVGSDLYEQKTEEKMKMFSSTGIKTKTFWERKVESYRECTHEGIRVLSPQGLHDSAAGARAAPHGASGHRAGSGG